MSDGFLVVDKTIPNTVSRNSTHKSFVVHKDVPNLVNKTTIYKSKKRNVVVRTHYLNSVTITKQPNQKWIFGSGTIPFVLDVRVGDIFVDLSTGVVFVYIASSGGGFVLIHIGQFTEDLGIHQYTFSSITPTSPSRGDIWLGDLGSLFTFAKSGVSNKWTEMSSTSGLHTNDSISASLVPPNSPNNGDIWYDLNTGSLMFFLTDASGGTSWVDYTE